MKAITFLIPLCCISLFACGQKRNAKSLNKTYTASSESVYTSFYKAYQRDSVKYAVYFRNADKVKNLSDSLFNYIKSIKDTLAMNAGGWTPGSDHAVVGNNQELLASNKFLMEKKGGTRLKDSLILFKKQLFSLVIVADPQALKAIEAIDVSSKQQKDGTLQSWEEYYWKDVPAIAAITQLTKFQNDIRNAEMEVMGCLYKQVAPEKKVK